MVAAGSYEHFREYSFSAHATWNFEDIQYIFVMNLSTGTRPLLDELTDWEFLKTHNQIVCLKNILF